MDGFIAGLAALAVAKQPMCASGSPTASMAVGSVQSSVTGTLTTTVDTTNSGTEEVPDRDPYLGLRACIAMLGVFPTRP